jgi:hypothetical protein
MAAGAPTSLTTTMDRPNPGTLTWGAIRRTAARKEVSAAGEAKKAESAEPPEPAEPAESAEPDPGGSARTSRPVSAAIRLASRSQSMVSSERSE